MKRIMAFLLSLCVLSVFAPCLPVFAENEILIGTLDELISFRDAVNNGNSFSGQTVRLTADIDLEGSEDNQWTPIGDMGKNFNFEGHFNGNNHKITGLYINNNSANSGLFGEITGFIMNLNIDGYLKSDGYVGGIVGCLSDGSIINCSSSATIIGRKYIGGIVGYNCGVIEKCYNSGNVIGSTYSVGNIDPTGGIAGTNSSMIKNCYNSGAIMGTSSYADNIGGIVGVSYSDDACIEKCYNIGKITAESDSALIGAIAGENNSKISDCFYLTGSAATDSSATELTAEQFADINIFADAGWDFDSVWKMSKAFKRPILQDNSEFATPTFGVGETDSGSYQTVDAETLGVIRFLQEYSGEEVSSYGFYFVDSESNIIENSEIKAEGSFDTDGFYGDLTDIKTNDLNNYYAMPFVTVNDDIYMGKSIPGTVDWGRNITYPNAEE